MFSKPLLQAKLKAALIHVSLSGVIFVPLAYLILFRWFPGPLFFTDGGWQGVRIMLLVDMVLGPTLTFMVYNPAKSRLALGVDFGFIGIVQAVALAYGIWTIEETRIWAIAYNTTFDSFMAVGHDQLVKQDIAPEAWAPLGDDPQYWVYVRPARPEELPRVEALGNRGVPAEALFMLYEPLPAHKQDIFGKELNMPKLAAVNPALARKYQDFLQDHGGSAQGLHFFRLVGFYRSVIIAVDDETRYAGFINHDVTGP